MSVAMGHLLCELSAMNGAREKYPMGTGQRLYPFAC